MEDLLRSLRNIGLALPDQHQLLQLGDPDPKVQEDLARLLALNPAKDDLIQEDDINGSSNDEEERDACDNDDSENDSESIGGVDPLMDADLFRGAVQALLENYNKLIDKERDTLQREKSLLLSSSSSLDPKKLKSVPFKALLARQNAEIKRRQDELYVAAYDPETGRKRKTFYLPRQTFDGVDSFSSELGWSDLTRIDFEELATPKRFQNSYLLCQVASQLNLYVSCTLIVTLPSGHALPVSISHYTDLLHLSADQLDATLPIGTVLAIKEPFVSLNHFAKGGPALGGKTVHGIRVDTPSDVHIVDGLSEYDAALIDGISWNVAVNADAGQHFDSISSVWTDTPVSVDSKGCRWLQDGPLGRFAAWKLNVAESALPPPPPLAELQQSFDKLDSQGRQQLRNRTRSLIQSFLDAGRPGAAYREAVAAFFLGIMKTDQVVDDLELFANILSRLGEYEQARHTLEAALQALPKQEQRQEAASRIQPLLSAMIAAQKTSALGPSHDDIRKYYLESQSQLTPRFQLADWFGPVTIEQIDGAGRGLVLTRDVPQGELLLCCKAIASSYSMDQGCRGIHVLRYTVETGVTSTTTQVLAATKSIHAILDRPHLALPILGLTAGPDTPHSKWVQQRYPEPPQRTWQDTTSTTPNLPLSLTSFSTIQRILIEGLDKPVVNSGYVDGVLRFNAFGPAAHPGSGSNDNNQQVQDSELSRSTMVHPLPAILNHACLPNVSSVFFGDIVTTRALGDLKKGTQIMHQYVRGETAWPLRRSQLSKHGFQCQCQLCLLDQLDGDSKNLDRQRWLSGSLPMLLETSRILRTSSSHNSDLDSNHKQLSNSFKTLLDQIQSTYHSNRIKSLQPDLFSICQNLSLHQQFFNLPNSILSLQYALESIGGGSSGGGEDGHFVFQLPKLYLDGSIQSILSLAYLHHFSNQLDQAKIWIGNAFKIHQATIGGGLDVFLDRWQVVSKVPLRDWLQEQQQQETV